MSEIHALSGAYAVDALDDTERKHFEQHLDSCPDCQAEVQSLREAAAVLAEMTAVAPPPDLRARLLADIAVVRPLPPLTTPVAPPAEPTGSPETVTSLDSRRRRRLPVLLAAAAAAAVIGAGAVAWEPWAPEQGSQQLTATEQVLAAPDAEEVEHTFDDGAVATVVRSASLGQAVIVTSDMAPAPNGKVYQLWFQDDQGTMQPAGVMPARADQTVLLEGDAATAQAVGITVEPSGGSLHPTTAPVVVFDLEQTV